MMSPCPACRSGRRCHDPACHGPRNFVCTTPSAPNSMKPLVLSPSCCHAQRLRPSRCQRGPTSEAKASGPAASSGGSSAISMGRRTWPEGLDPPLPPPPPPPPPLVREWLPTLRRGGLPGPLGEPPVRGGRLPAPDVRLSKPGGPSAASPNHHRRAMAQARTTSKARSSVTCRPSAASRAGTSCHSDGMMDISYPPAAASLRAGRYPGATRTPSAHPRRGGGAPRPGGAGGVVPRRSASATWWRARAQPRGLCADRA